MPSAIDPTKPLDGVPAAKSDFRAALQTIKTELEHGGFVRAAAAGAAERTAQDKLSEWLSVRDFMAAADPDATNGLIRMRDHMLAEPSKTWVVHFPPGLYQYTNNRWLRSVRRFVLEAYGAQFQCTSAGSSERDGRPLNVSDMFDNNPDAPWTGGAGIVMGHRISAAAAGDTVITMTTPGEEAVYAAGDRVLIHGFNNQASSSYPPNLRYFEWKVVGSVGSGTLILTVPLKHSYDDRWPDWQADFGAPTSVVGKPRVLLLDRVGKAGYNNYRQIEFALVRGARFLRNPNNANFANVALWADTLICEDIDADVYAQGFVRDGFFKRCRLGNVEADKIVGNLNFDDCIVTLLRYASGVDMISCRRCHLFGHLAVASRTFRLEDCDLYTNVNAESAGHIRIEGGWPMRLLSIKGLRVHNRSGTTLSSVVSSATRTLTVAGVGPGTAIRVDANATNRDTVLQRLDIGHHLCNTDGSNFGRVTAIYDDGTSYVVEGTWPVTPVISDVYSWRAEVEWLDHGGHEIIGRRVPLFQHQTDASPGRMRVVHLSSDDINWRGNNRTMRCRGRVCRLQAHVAKAYTGPDADPKLHVNTHDGVSEVTIATIDLKTMGLREVTAFGNNGAQAGDVLNASNMMLYASLVRLYMRQGGTTISGTDAEMPRAHLTLEIAGNNV